MLTLLIGPSRQNPILDELAGLLGARRGFDEVEFVTLDRAQARISKGGFELAFVVLTNGRVGDALDIVRALRAAGGAHVLVVGPATDPKLILGALQAGGDRFLDQDELALNLDAVLGRLYPGAAARQVLAVLSASGGCGASTVAVNLAVVLAAEYGRCNLIDLNTNKPDLAPLLDLRPQYTLSDLCEHEDRLDRTLYEKLLTGHPSGMALLAGPRAPADALRVTPRGVSQALALARGAFANVVVDLENWFGAEQRVVLEQATRILLVCRLDFTALRNARRILDHLSACGIPRGRVEVVVNHVGSPGELPLADAQEALGVELAHRIPHAPEIISRATNTGVPAATGDPRSPVVRGIARLVGLDASVDHESNGFAGFAARVRGRVLHWVRSLRTRSTGPTPSLAAARAAEESKVCHESLIVSESVADQRACPA